ncbi:Dual specificity testis-specific protein kinase 2 [Portunus trituberculatus]|uniref:Dual specificity testis-specific protein kinase 2 n=1 Tax=Portunus trituberculatus TaxID=210409 RepID=A0A5B7IQ49_PORTR|nr:Dual specificity testis-specific protein kinase 2 [Portunus trituberculatus]
MCQQDCPALFLQLAFMCCQIDPASRPSFEELKAKLEYLLAQLTSQSTCCTARKLKGG